MMAQQTERKNEMKVRWGVLGVAKIAVNQVIPAMQQGERCEVMAIASRQLERAETAAGALRISRAYGSYEELIADPDIEAIYNPLPNHLHVPWSIKALEAGKHVLCEKPIGLSVAEARQLLKARDQSGKKVAEAFMVRTHPQWLATRDLIRAGRIGELRSIAGFFSYFNRDPKNIRNIPDYGGGGLMDIGCYPITTARFVFGQEPVRAVALIERDPETKVDRLTSALLDFPAGQAIFTCSTQLFPYQRMQFLGTKGRIEVEIPFNAPVDRPSRIFIEDGPNGIETKEFSVCNQYTIQGDLFSQAIREDGKIAVPIEDAINNMAVIEALFRSAETGKWELCATSVGSVSPW
jgi:predicted dehydrogenase